MPAGEPPWKYWESGGVVHGHSRAISKWPLCANTQDRDQALPFMGGLVHLCCEAVKSSSELGGTRQQQSQKVFSWGTDQGVGMPVEFMEVWICCLSLTLPFKLLSLVFFWFAVFVISQQSIATWTKFILCRMWRSLDDLDRYNDGLILFGLWYQNTIDWMALE